MTAECPGCGADKDPDFPEPCASYCPVDAHRRFLDAQAEAAVIDAGLEALRRYHPTLAQELGLGPLDVDDRM